MGKAGFDILLHRCCALTGNSEKQTAFVEILCNGCRVFLVDSFIQVTFPKQVIESLYADFNFYTGTYFGEETTKGSDVGAVFPVTFKGDLANIFFRGIFV